MIYPSIHERLKILAPLIQRRGDLHEYLDLQRKIWQAQLDAEASNRGVHFDGIEKLPMSSLEQKALERKEPLIHFLDPEVVDPDTFQSLFRKIVEIITSTRPDHEGLRQLLTQIEAEKIDPLKLIAATLQEDEHSIRRAAEKYTVEPSLFLFLVSTSLQPIIEEVARRASPAFYGRWWQAPCPICGRKPSVARMRDRQRYLLCGFCGSEYLSDYFLCVNCGNKDPYTLKYMKIEGKPEFQIDFCTKCRNYIKVIIERALSEAIPRCVEDVLTLDLDVEAKHAGLIREG